MLDIHLYGKFRQLAEKKGATDNSTLSVEYEPEESFVDLLKRIGIDPNEIGEIFVNHKVVELDHEIEDDSRIAIFPMGMHLLCGGQHLKGHGYITKKVKKTNYF